MPSLAFNTIYVKIWNGLSNLEKDPYMEVSNMAKTLTEYVRNKVADVRKCRSVQLHQLL